MQTETQFSATQVLRGITSSGGKLASIAAVSMLITALIPVASVSGSVMGMGGGSMGLTSINLAGALGWVVVLLFAAAAAARSVRAIRPYRNLIDLAAFGMLAVAVIWSFFGGPAASELGTLNQMNGLLGTNGVNGLTGRPFGGGAPRAPMVSISVLPSFGALFLVLAPIALFMARRRPDAASVSSLT